MKPIAMKSIIAVACAGLIGGGAILAAETAAAPNAIPPSNPPSAHSWQNAPHRAPWAARRMQALRRHWMHRLSRRLGLDKTQRTALRQVHAQAMASIWAARADASLTPDQRREEIRAAVDTGRNQFQGLLKPDQREKLDRIEGARERSMLGL
jgi:hypothetical protein